MKVSDRKQLKTKLNCFQEPNANGASFLQQTYMTQRINEQSKFNLNVHYSAINDSVNIWSSPTEAQPNVMNFTKSYDDLWSNEQRESKTNYKK